MPFTPFHMGPGILIKSLLHGGFSLMIFGWAQIVMDIQPLFVLLNGEGHLHGFSHTFIGAFLIGAISAISGKYLSEVGLYLLGMNKRWELNITWPVAVFSAYIGTVSHVLLDAIMHPDVEPFYPYTNKNVFLQWLSVDMLHQFCLYTAAIGAVVFYSMLMFKKIRNKS